MMRLNLAFLGIALILLSFQLGSVQAVDCQDIWVDVDDIITERNETEYFYFPIYNDSEEDFAISEAKAWREDGEFEILLTDYPDVIDAEDEGELTIRVKTGSLDEESFGSAYVEVRGSFEDEYCGFGEIGESYFDVVVEVDDSDHELDCSDIAIYTSNVYIDEDSTKTVSFEIENFSDQDFDLQGLEIEENSSYFDGEIYSKPSEIRGNDSESFRVRIESERVSRDREGDARIRARGRFDSGEYCSYSETEDDEFTVFVENDSGGPSPGPSPERECDSIHLNAGAVRARIGETGFATVFIENNSPENFLIDYVSVFDSSPNFKAEEKGYGKLVPSFGSTFVNVAVRAYDYAKTGREQAFVEARGHFQNQQTCTIFGDSIASFPVVIEERAGQGPVQDNSQGNCDLFSLHVPNNKEISKSGTIPITIDNRTMERASIRLSGPGLEVQPKLISIPRNSLVSENIRVSSKLAKTSLVYSIEALGCSRTKSTSIIARGIEEEQEEEEEEGQAEGIIEGISTGFFVLGQAGTALALILLAAAVIYLILRPRMA